jgi:predicted nucleic acid-binding protein
MPPKKPACGSSSVICVVLPLDEPVIQQTIRLRQQHRVKLPDAIIAATALVHGLPLLTRNTADFSALPGLTLLNPHDPAQLLAAS